MTEKLYTLREVGVIFAVKPETVRFWIRHNKIRGVKIGQGYYWRVPESAVEEFANKHYGDTRA